MGGRDSQVLAPVGGPVRLYPRGRGRFALTLFYISEMTKYEPWHDHSDISIVTGKIGVKEIECLIQKLEIDKEILADQGGDAPAAGSLPPLPYSQ
jgi:hypothetical protein